MQRIFFIMIKPIFEQNEKQMFSSCNYCKIPYDVIGHMETFDQDLDLVLRLAGVERDQEPKQESVTKVPPFHAHR